MSKGMILWGWVALLAVVMPSAAHAAMDLSLDANGIVRLRNVESHEIKFGLAGRLGYRIGGTGVVNVTPEVVGEWDRFGAHFHAVRVLGGVRISGGKVIQPGVFGHVGWGRVDFDDTDDDNVSFDVGAALDFVAIPVLKLGVQAAYNLINIDPAFDFASFGAHISLVF